MYSLRGQSVCHWRGLIGAMGVEFQYGGACKTGQALSDMAHDDTSASHNVAKHPASILMWRFCPTWPHCRRIRQASKCTCSKGLSHVVSVLPRRYREAMGITSNINRQETEIELRGCLGTLQASLNGSCDDRPAVMPRAI